MKVESKPRWARRKFLLAATAASAALAGGYATVQWFFGDPEDIVLAVLRRRVGYLRVKEQDLLSFAAEYAAWKGRGELLGRLSMIAPPMRFFTPYPWLKPGHSMRRLEDSIVSQFLLSTDFFSHNADENRDIVYLGFYDPHSAACRNPFFRPVRDASRSLEEEKDSSPSKPRASSGTDKDAQDHYRGACATCHGDEGRGDGPTASGLTPRPTDFSGATWQDS